METLRQPRAIQQEYITGFQLAEGGMHSHADESLRAACTLSQLNEQLVNDYPNEFPTPLQPVVYLACPQPASAEGNIAPCVPPGAIEMAKNRR